MYPQQQQQQQQHHHPNKKQRTQHQPRALARELQRDTDGGDRPSTSSTAAGATSVPSRSTTFSLSSKRRRVAADASLCGSWECGASITVTTATSEKKKKHQSQKDVLEDTSRVADLLTTVIGNKKGPSPQLKKDDDDDDDASHRGADPDRGVHSSPTAKRPPQPSDHEPLGQLQLLQTVDTPMDVLVAVDSSRHHDAGADRLESSTPENAGILESPRAWKNRAFKGPTKLQQQQHSSRRGDLEDTGGPVMPSAPSAALPSAEILGLPDQDKTVVSGYVDLIPSPDRGSAPVQSLDPAAIAAAAVAVVNTDMPALPQQTRNARVLYVGNLPPLIDTDQIHRAFKKAINLTLQPGSGIDVTEDPIHSVHFNFKNRFCFLEFKTVEMCSACLKLNGLVVVMPSQPPVKVERPNKYNPALAPPETNKPVLDLSKLGSISQSVLECSNEIFVGGWHYHLEKSYMLERLQAFGEVKSFRLGTKKKKRATTLSRGFCFVEYVDPALTLVAIAGLNGSDIGGGKSLTAHLAEERRRGPVMPSALPAALPSAAIPSGGN
jgi:hypothetical protein